jgi:hypothetical protein
MVKHVDAVELRIDIAAVLSAAAGAFLVALQLPKHGGKLVTAPAFLHVQNLAGRSSLEAVASSSLKSQRTNVHGPVIVPFALWLRSFSPSRRLF